MSPPLPHSGPVVDIKESFPCDTFWVWKAILMYQPCYVNCQVYKKKQVQTVLHFVLLLRGLKYRVSLKNALLWFWYPWRQCDDFLECRSVVKCALRWQKDRKGEGYVPLSNYFGLGNSLWVKKHFLNWSFLATASTTPKQSILKVNLIQYRNILVQNHWFMKRRPLHCGRFVPLRHILRLLISELRFF